MVKTLSNARIRGQIASYNQNKYKSYEKLLEIFKDKYDWLN